MRSVMITALLLSAGPLEAREAHCMARGKRKLLRAAAAAAAAGNGEAA